MAGRKWNTLSVEARALKTASRRANSLSSEVAREISNCRFIHPTALLIKDLEFEYWGIVLAHNGIYQATRLRIAGDLCLMSYVPSPRNYRHYYLRDFSDAEYHRYQIDNDSASGILLGRVSGTEQWGHEVL